MPASFTLDVDTQGPQGVTAAINGGDAKTNSVSASLTVGTSDSDTTGYQMKIWGADLQGGPATEGAASWVAYTATTAITLTTGDGTKSVSVKLRDDVLNESSTASDSITLDQTVPVANITVNPDKTTVSAQAGSDVSTFSWQSDSVFDAYEIRVVPNSGSIRTAGTLIGTTNGSTNVAGSAGGYPANTNIQTALHEQDVVAASPGDGAKVIKIFVRDQAGNWSV